MSQAQQSPTLSGSFRLFRVAGISVYLHWSWFLVAYLMFQFRANEYTVQGWAIAEYLALFVIVLMHEFGHALACRQVGGQADEIVLWPLGGIAFVRPPARPGALLWSIAAGPLVNVVLVPFTVAAYAFGISQELQNTSPDALRFLDALMMMNGILLFFNILPIYPLDGGQILHALLWFVVGRATSLLAVSIIGIPATIIVIGSFAWWSKSILTAVIGIFMIMRCVAGFRQARLLAQLERAPRHRDAACPSCHAHPLKGDFWRCNQCGTRFDTFTHHGVCPACSERFFRTACPECTQTHHIDDWFDEED